MHLSFVTSNILHQVLSPEINIVYAPYNYLFDHILYTIDYNFFVFDGSYRSKADNCLGLPDSHRDLYSYDLYIHNDLVSASQSTTNRMLHTNMLIFEHRSRNPRLKKEDLAILNHKLSKTTKVFFDDGCSNSWNQNNSITINYGIPSNIFNNTINYGDRKSVLIYSDTNQMLTQQVHSYLSNNDIDCNILSYSDLSIKDINKKLNNYKLILNLSSDKLLTLCGIACGCQVVTTDQSGTNIPGVHYQNAIPSIINDVPNILNLTPDYDSMKEYINHVHNFDIFIAKLQNIIHTTAKREAFIL